MFALGLECPLATPSTQTNPNNADRTTPEGPRGRPRKPENKTAKPTLAVSRGLSLGESRLFLRCPQRGRGLFTNGRWRRQPGFRALRLATTARPYLSISRSFPACVVNAMQSRPRAPPRWKIVLFCSPRRLLTDPRGVSTPRLWAPRRRSSSCERPGGRAEGGGPLRRRWRRDSRRIRSGRAVGGPWSGRGRRAGGGRNMSPAAGR